MYFPKKTILAKIETTYGTDPVPTGAANAIIAKNLNLTPLDAQMIDRNVVLPFFGNLGAIPGSAFVKADFEVEITGSSAAGTAPPYGPLLRACGLSETITALTSVAYAPISASFESATIYINVDGIQHKITGCRGTVSLDFANEAIPSYKFSITGIYAAPTDTALPSLTLTAWQTPLACNKVNTTFSLHGYSAVMSKANLDAGNDVQAKSYPNTSQDVRITNRKSKGKATFEMTSVATKDWFALARAGTTGALQIVHGTAAGNIITIAAAQAQLGNPKYTDEGGIVMCDVDLMLQSTSAGNDEFTITVT